MKRKYRFICFCVLMVVCAASVIFLSLRTETAKTPNRSTQIPHKVYRIGDEVCKSPIDVQEALLAVSDIEEVYLLPLGSDEEPYKLTKEEVLELSSLLTKVELKKNGSKKHLEYDGVFYKMFLIVYSSGTQIKFSASNPFYIVDGVGYKSEYHPCDEISRLYWSLLREYFPH